MENVVSVKKNKPLIKIVHPVNLGVLFEQPSFPFGRCINLGPGLRARNGSVDVLAFYGNSTHTRSKVQVFIQDPINGNNFSPIGNKMRGGRITFKPKPAGLLLKLHTEFSLFKHVKGDPQYDCEEYFENNTYTDCLEAEHLSNFHNWIGCHPPLISMKEGYCNASFNLTKEDTTYKRIYKYLSNITNAFHRSVCKRPCTHYVFHTKKLYVQKSKLENGLMMVFSQTVEYTKTSFLIGMSRFLTGLGGAISGGKTLLWTILTVLGFLDTVGRVKNMIL